MALFTRRIGLRSLLTGIGSSWPCRLSCRVFSAEAVSNPSNEVQVYVSKSFDPYVNLSIEHFLLQKSPSDSVILFLYRNSPCVVIGRNQNPWVETKLSRVRPPGPDDDGKPLLVRRRSGGGTVFHDLGNANYSVIWPTESFDRDKHANMVVRALDSLGVEGSPHVNERHDIVVHKPESESGTTTMETDQAPPVFKISGSAYKLTRKRSLHHGTCLLNSPNLDVIGDFLRSPAAPYINARGVKSVRSPIRNIGVEGVGVFEDAVVAEFVREYGEANDVTAEGRFVTAEDAFRIPSIREGIKELKSLEWLYCETPQFIFSSHRIADDERQHPKHGVPLPPSDSLLSTLSPEFKLGMTVRDGKVIDCGAAGAPDELDHMLQTRVLGATLHTVVDWRDNTGHDALGEWMNGLLRVVR